MWLDIPCARRRRGCALRASVWSRARPVLPGTREPWPDRAAWHAPSGTRRTDARSPSQRGLADLLEPDAIVTATLLHRCARAPTLRLGGAAHALPLHAAPLRVPALPLSDPEVPWRMVAHLQFRPVSGAPATLVRASRWLSHAPPRPRPAASNPPGQSRMLSRCGPSAPTWPRTSSPEGRRAWRPRRLGREQATGNPTPFPTPPTVTS